MPTLEWLHVIGSVAWVIMALYVGRAMSQLKNVILDAVKKDYVSKDVAVVEKQAVANLLAAIEDQQRERYNYSKEALEELKQGHIKITERLDDLYARKRSDTPIPPTRI